MNSKLIAVLSVLSVACLLAGFVIAYHDSSEPYEHTNTVLGNRGSIADADTDIEVEYDTQNALITTGGSDWYSPGSVNSFLIVSDRITIYVSDAGGTIQYGAYITSDDPATRVNSSDIVRIIISISNMSSEVSFYDDAGSTIRFSYTDQRWIAYADPDGDYALTSEKIGNGWIYFSKSDILYAIYSEPAFGYVSFRSSECFEGSEAYPAILRSHYDSDNHVYYVSGSGYYYADPHELTGDANLPVIPAYVLYPVTVTVEPSAHLSVHEIGNSFLVLLGIEFALLAVGAFMYNKGYYEE